MTHLRPILSALGRHKSAAAIVLLEIALTCAILCNALFVIQRRIESINTRSGVDEARLLHVSLTGIGQQDDAMAQTRTDLAALRALPGVANASMVSQLPLTRSSWNTSIDSKPDTVAPPLNTTLYMGDAAMIDTFGVKFESGRPFTAEEYIQITDEAGFGAMSPRAAIVTRRLADALYPAGGALGKPLYMGTPQPVTIVGIVDRLLRPASDQWGDQQAQYSMLLPVEFPYTLAHHYVIRTDAGADRQRVLQAAVDTLKRLNPRRVMLDKQTFVDIRGDYFAQDKAMVWLLSLVSLILLAVTAFGIVGLASFWVQQRTKQIGVRRALGATRGQILRYFQAENFLIVSGGIVLGMLLAFAINQWLMARYELPRLPWQVLPLGAAALWLLGQAAVLWPALRAASIPPATATRTV